MRLDLWNAEARGELVSSGSEKDAYKVNWRSFTHADKPFTVIELVETGSASPAKVVFQHAPAMPAREEYRKETIPPEEMNPLPAFGENGSVKWCLQRFKAGGGYVVAWGERKLAEHRRSVYFTVDFALKGSPESARAVSDIERAMSSDFDDHIHTHRQWWHQYFPQSFLSIPDTRMESFYWIQMYKLASATRADRPALDLMGPWFRRTPWPKIWWNLNIQLTYWPVYTANHLPPAESLIPFLPAP